jgi:hypothetical protein
MTANFDAEEQYADFGREAEHGYRHNGWTRRMAK